MQRTMKMISGTMLAAALAAGCATNSNGAAVALPASGPQHPVYKVFMDGIAAFNAKDLETFMEQWDDDIQMYTADAGWLRGKPAVRARFVTTFERFPNVHMDIEDLRVTAIAPTVAIVDFRHRTYPRGSGPAFHGVGSGTYVLRAGNWVEVLEHESISKIDEELQRR